ncbi:hypothetical protein [Pleionea sp. CnH1-48]|uniref:hypothetical protein n=1 Tax=Pleionea sp. CnH1-48 TaxID=2954494 RepID=UPI002098411C|nr:hypothetical protein [Pleionea sp. CnH1-48]MCO7224220.1 hypothetical protein [Pleionea sp. CnH1-48]
MILVNFTNGIDVPFFQPIDRASTDDSLSFVTRATTDGADIFEAISAALSITTGAYWAGVTRLPRNAQQITVLAMWEDDHFCDCFHYDLEHTPCEIVTQSQQLCHYVNVQEDFPEDEALIQMGVKEYAGQVYRDFQGNVLGHLFMLNKKPCSNFVHVEQIMQQLVAFLEVEIRMQSSNIA